VDLFRKPFNDRFEVSDSLVANEVGVCLDDLPSQSDSASLKQRAVN
jgi:hypothetical protein